MRTSSVRLFDCVCVFTWAGGCFPLQRKSSSEPRFHCAEWTWAALQNPAESLHYHNSIRDKKEFLHTSVSVRQQFQRGYHLCVIWREEQEMRMKGDWDSWALSVQFALITDVSDDLIISAIYWVICKCVYGSRSRWEKKPDCVLQYMDPFHISRARKRKKVIIFGETTTNNIVFTFAPIAKINK